MTISWNKTYQNDNIDILRQMVKEGLTFNLILTDPPYNIGKNFGNDSDKQELSSFLKTVDERLKLMQKLLSRNGSIIWFCTHKYVGDIQVALRQYFQQRRLMIWHYENGMSRQLKEPVTEYDPFWWFSSSDNFIYNADEVRVPYKTDRVKNPVYKLDTRGNKKAWMPNPKGRKRGDVWKYPTLAGSRFQDERTEHPCQKPISLWTDLLKAFCPKNSNGKYEGRVLDPYHGAGTTGVCCEKLNVSGNHQIKWIGCELEQKWARCCDERTEQERNRTVETDMFDE